MSYSLSEAEINQFIEQTSNQIELESNPYSKASLLYTVIELKLMKRNHFGLHNEIYIDLKNFTVLYLEGLNHRGYSYDNVNLSNIFKLLDKLELGAQTSFLNFLIFKLNEAGFSDYVPECTLKLNTVREGLYWKSKSYLDKIKLLYLLITLTPKRVLITILLLFSLIVMVLIPAPYSWMETIDIELINYNTFSPLNYISNAVAFLLQVDDRLKPRALNWVGVVLLSLLKITTLLIIVNILIKQLSFFVSTLFTSK